jgi:AraC family transcriptional regulator of adaptative response/methylated-DNA-[protein]-cysteine methyltransferase
MTERLPATPERLSEAFAARDRSWDGRFVVAVTTTGIYCRPSCPARRPRPENMRFFAAGEQAEAEGFRPCRRCAPDAVARDRAAVELAIALIRDNDGPVRGGAARCTQRDRSAVRCRLWRAVALL